MDRHGGTYWNSVLTREIRVMVYNLSLLVIVLCEEAIVPHLAIPLELLHRRHILLVNACL